MKKRYRIGNRILALLLVTTLLCTDWYQSFWGNAALPVRAAEAITETTEDGQTYEELAETLQTPLAIYTYLKNHLNYEPYSGLRKGAAATFDSMAGNDVDQAALLIAMLESRGYEARYVKGRIRMDGEAAMKLTGAADVNVAGDILSLGGEPAEILYRNGEVYGVCVNHVWVEANLPYGDYRGGGKAAGEKHWIALDVSFKETEARDCVYDHYEEWGLTGEAVEGAESYEEIRVLLEQWESTFEMHTEGESYGVTRKTIKEEELPYLPLSLPYDVLEESYRGEEPEEDWRDTVSIRIGEGDMVTLTSEELYKKSLMIAYEETEGGMTGMLYVGEEAAAEGTPKAFGEEETLSLEVVSGGRKETIQNTLKAGSLYSLTVDMQMITASEFTESRERLQKAAQTATEECILSREYLGSLLEMAGKLYFAQADILDRMLLEQMELGAVRSLSVGMTGYEITSGVGEEIFGNLFIDIDFNARRVAGGSREEANRFFLTSGMLSSALESGVWEELTGIPSVSTIAVFQAAREEGMELFFLTDRNWAEKKSRMEASEEVLSDIEAAIHRGATVIANPQEVTIGDWSGTGYQILEADGTTAQYRITGGNNGGELALKVGGAYLASSLMTAVDLCQLMMVVPYILSLFSMGGPAGIVAGVALSAVTALLAYITILNCYHNIQLMYAFMDGSDEAGEEVIENAIWDLAFTALVLGFGQAAKGIVRHMMGNHLAQEFGQEFVDKLLKNSDDITTAGRAIKKLRKLNVGDDVIREMGERFGQKGYDWLLNRASLNLSDDIIKKLMHTDNFLTYSDDLLRAIQKSNGYADDIIRQVEKYGDDAADAIAKYGDDAVVIIGTYGDDAIGFINKYGDDAIDVIYKYEDDAIDGLKKGMSPSETKWRLTTKLDYVTSTGLQLESTPGKTTTILGTYASDTGAIIKELGNYKSLDFGSRDGGFNLLNTPDELYRTPEQFWVEYNKPWLDNVIERKDIIYLATEPTDANLYCINNLTGKIELTGFGKEYTYLLENRYIYDSISKRMIRE